MCRLILMFCKLVIVRCVVFLRFVVKNVFDLLFELFGIKRVIGIGLFRFSDWLLFVELVGIGLYVVS